MSFTRQQVASTTFIKRLNILFSMYKKRYEVGVGRDIFNYFSGRKGQVTIFIIMGILLLLAVLLIVFVRKEIVTFKPEVIIPTQRGEVENYVASCIEKIGDEALFIVGLQGGYIKVPAELAADGSTHLRLSPMHVVPFWAYGTVENIQSLEQIKQRIDSYMEENLKECTFGLEPFQQTYDIIEKSGITANTEIVESKVIFNVRWNLEVRDKAGEIITEILDHAVESPIKLKKVQETARRIIEQELQTLKLEDLTQDLIALEHPDVPVAGMEMSCSKKRWDVDQVKDILQDMLRVNIGQLKVERTDFVEFPENLPYYQNHYVWNLGDDFARPDVSVTFSYENTYPFTFQVTPIEGKKMSSSSLGGTDKLSFLCIQQWKFTYDVVYPILVRVRDETTGYNFNIAFTVHLVRNMPDRESQAFARPSMLLDFATADDYCEELRVPMNVVTWQLIENEKEGVYDLEPLEDVKIGYTCLKYRCDMGATDFNFAQTGYQAGLSLNFPYCVGGIMRGEKEGYKESWERATSENGKEINLYLAPLLSYPLNKVKVVKHDLSGESIGPAVSLGKDDLALIRLTAYKGGEKFHEIEQVAGDYLDKETASRMKMDFLAEANFEYEVKIDLFDGDEIIGGYHANWTVPWEQLLVAEEIIFHTVTREGEGDAAMFDLVSGLESYSKDVPSPELNVRKGITIN